MHLIHYRPVLPSLFSILSTKMAGGKYRPYSAFEKTFAASTVDYRLQYANMMAEHAGEETLLLIEGSPEIPKNNAEWEEHYAQVTRAFDETEDTLEKELVLKKMEDIYKKAEVNNAQRGQLQIVLHANE